MAPSLVKETQKESSFANAKALVALVHLKQTQDY